MNLVLTVYVSSEGSGKPAHPRSLARTSAARSYKQWVKRNIQTESQIPGSSIWLGMQLKSVMTECSKTQIRLYISKTQIRLYMDSCDTGCWSNYSSSRINVHLMFPLFPEKQKSILKSFNGKKLFTKCNPPDFQFHPCSKLINKNFPHMVLC